MCRVYGFWLSVEPINRCILAGIAIVIVQVQIGASESEICSV